MQLDIILSIQSMANPFLDKLFVVLTFLGEPLAAVAVLTIVYWLCDKEAGEFMAFSLFLSLNLNGFVKNLFAAPRPIGQPGVRTLRDSTATGFSFPSGHTQSASTLLSSLALAARRWYAWVIAAIVIAGVGLSRLYLGVHWPIDVLAAVVLGLAASLLVFFFYSRLNPQGRTILFWVAAALFIPLLLYKSDADFVKSYGLLLGFAVAVPLEHKLVDFTTDDVSVPHMLLREILGLLLVGAVKIGLSFILPHELAFMAAEYFMISITAFFLCPLMFKLLNI